MMPNPTRFMVSMLGSIVWWSGVAISLTLFLLTDRTVTQKAQLEFGHLTEHTSTGIEDRVRSHTDVLRGVQALFASREQLTRTHFNDYVRQLDLEQNFPGVVSLNFAPLVLESDRAEFERNLRSDPLLPAGFAITPPGKRAEYQVLTYVEPLNTDALGFDVAANEDGAAALAMARDTGQITSSGRVIATGDLIKLALRLPLYRSGMALDSLPQRRAAYYGSVGARFDLRSMILGAKGENGLRILRVRLFDMGRADQTDGEAEPERLLFDSVSATNITPTGVTPPAASHFLERVPLDVGSRQWELEFSADPALLIHGLDAFLPWIMLIGGLGGSALLFAVNFSLVTARRRAVDMARDMTKDLRSSEANLAETQHMTRFGSWVLDLDRMQMTWSLETYWILGIRQTQKAPSYNDFMNRVHPGDREAVRDGLARLFVSGDEFDLEHRIDAHDGATRWVRSIVRRTNSEQKLLRGALMDITERKHTMEALKHSQELLRDLTAHQERVREDERKRIAREIHDELGQTLLALRIDVSMLEARTGKSHPRINQRVRGALHQIDATVRTIRNIINNLRPAVLDLGLTAAIEWQVAQFRRRSGIACELILSDTEFTADDARATSLFRILQESLTNVIRHANASKVTITLEQQDDWLILRISDNGIGIYPGDRRNDSFGLVSIEERVHALNGDFSISCPPGEGTTLTIRTPLNSVTKARLEPDLMHSA
jgi:signal transduction histidine kinase